MKPSLYIFFSLLLSLIILPGSAQTVHLEPQYAVNRNDSDVFYGAPTDFRGCTDSLYLDLYKPVNQAVDRPIVLLLHGGSFVAGNRKAPNLVALADSLAARGYVVGVMDYRLGYFQPSNLTANFGCLIFQFITGISMDACVYPLDSMEMERALYRAQQDAKGAIRFLKGRTQIDSTSREKVFIGGESAGGFVSFAAAFLDQPFEKPAAAGAQSTAPTPTGANCGRNNICGSNDFSRPDLGGIRGSLNLNGESDEVTGVLSFAGGVFDLTLLDSNSTRPKLYVYHQECDPVVPCGTDLLFRRLNNCVSCSGCPTISRVPHTSGGCAIIDYNAGLPAAKQCPVWYDTIANGSAVSCYLGCGGRISIPVLNL